MDTKKVWFVTGASKGLGLSLMKKLLDAGYRVAATSRTLTDLEKEVGTSANFLPLETTVIDEASVSKAVAKIIETFGGIDIVVNNAGYDQLGALKELSDTEARENFDANVFGLLNVIRSVTLISAAKKSGHIINLKGFLRLAENQIAEYAEVRTSEKMHVEDIPGNQPGSPEKTADVLVKLVESGNPPLHLFLGSDSFNLANTKVGLIQSSLSEQITDFRN